MNGVAVTRRTGVPRGDRVGARAIMVQGTASSAGKSVICTALCRVFKQDGYRVYPFKSQNMALNSYVTLDGGEMGRAQVTQAEACGLEPHVDMNPILLKPHADTGSQVVILGRVFGNLTAREYYEHKPRLYRVIEEVYSRVRSRADIVVIEGAGSPAEINLNDRDFVNMGMASFADAPFILVGDIDRGGVFASLAGTMMLVDEDDRARVKGVIINKFRGDFEILKPGLEKLERIIRVPVLGVLPYMDLRIDDEDSVTEAFTRKEGGRDLRVVVVFLPHMSNFTDFTPLQREPDVALEYIDSPDAFGRPDLVILPGSKNTIGDLLYLRRSGMDEVIRRYHQAGGMVFGICGGFQMLGRRIADPHGMEGPAREVEGLGLLPVSTTIEREKRTVRVRGWVLENDSPLLGRCAGVEVGGYEIHMGVTEYPPATNGTGAGQHFCRITKALGYTGAEDVLLDGLDGVAAGARSEALDGWISGDGRAVGTYLHGVFESAGFVRRMLDSLRVARGLEPLGTTSEDYARFKDEQYDRLAAVFRRHVDVEAVYRIVFEHSESRTPA